MSIGEARSKLALSKSFINLQDQYLNRIMDVRRMPKGPINPMNNPVPKRSSSKSVVHFPEGRRLEYCKSFTQGGAGGRMMLRYFPLESLCLLVCLTVSLLILPLILPPLPPPPSMLLLLPICMLALLMFLAFMPSNARDATYTYA